jgi:hypothetical protein
MPMMTGLIGCMLVVLAIVHAFIPNHLFMVFMYGAGAVVALGTLKRNFGVHAARGLAFATTALMFFYFAGFFQLSLKFNAHWYHSGGALDGISMLFSAFAMIAVLSEYSCLLKAECKERLEQKRRAFFSVPHDIDRTIT